ncbi:response regulator [Pelagibacterium lentulum]|uniref:Response regulatory domain-containing protein n=1 Tax=Pelagibacterium lentulum TaxID=2029865 RepID=A0A916R9Y7_9HYPH|nr:response regulator [Pelagibacterium lentulum]GGA44899.1 hypothetical protein GCM10011499_13230 [Pelagibacterium lentulum]
MSNSAANLPTFVLVDDHVHSARLLRRTLHEAATPARLVWIGPAKRAGKTVKALLFGAPERKPDMIIVDLKAHSAATEEFIASIRDIADEADVPVVAIAPSLDGELRNALISAGARAVFERLADSEAYRAEMAHLTSYWVRETLTWPIRA